MLSFWITTRPVQTLRAVGVFWIWDSTRPALGLLPGSEAMRQAKPVSYDPVRGARADHDHPSV
jgi:hypothetical protein